MGACDLDDKIRKLECWGGGQLLCFMVLPPPFLG